MRRAIRGAVLALVAVLGAVACQGGQMTKDESIRSETGTIVDDGDVGVFALEVGDCVGDLPSEDETVVSSFEGVRCDGPHAAQVYAAYDVPLDEFPGDDEMFDLALDGCMERVPSTIEDDWGVDGSYVPYVLQPTSETWALDDREVMCLVVRLDGGTITGDLL